MNENVTLSDGSMAFERNAATTADDIARCREALSAVAEADDLLGLMQTAAMSPARAAATIDQVRELLTFALSANS